MSMLAATLELRLDQIGLLKDIRSILGFKTVRFYDGVIIIKESSDIKISDLNDKVVTPGTVTLETLQLLNQILKYERIMYL